MWKERQTEYGFNLIENEGGKTLGYCPESGVKILEQDGLAFKDLARTGELLPYEDWRLSAEERAADLAGRLSPEQIAGLMCYSVHQQNVTKTLNGEQKTFLDQYVRSVLNSCGMSGTPNDIQIGWANNMQRYAEGRPFGIPCYFASDPRNGCGVSDWPQNLSLAATFDPQLAKESAKCQSVELRNLGVACFLAPQVDIASDPRWYRFGGTFGEDPALSRDMTRAFCDGLQSTYDADGNDLGWGKDSLTAMVKHWTGEAASEGGREAHLEGGKYAVFPNGNFEASMIPFVDGAFRLEGKTKAAVAVMSSYTISFSEDGSLGPLVGSSFSEYKIKELLRRRYGYSGVVCTDWMVLNEGKKEGKRACGWGEVIEDPEFDPAERAFMALMAGADQMGGCSNPPVLVRAYEIGCERIGKEAMDAVFAASAQRLLLGYFLTGMFENPYLDERACFAQVNSPDQQQEALAAHIRSVIMLKNENHAIRPAGGRRKKVYIPALFEAAHVTFHHALLEIVAGDKVSYPVSLEAAGKYFDVVTDTVEGTTVTRASEEALRDCDLFLLPAKAPENSYPQDGRNKAGEFIPISLQYRPYTADGPHVRRVSVSGNRLPDGTKENRSYYGRQALTTNEGQLDQILELAGKAKKLGIPAVVCMFTERPLCFHEFEPEVDSILVTFSPPSIYGGENTASEALCRIAAGLDEPSGLLPIQMPRDMDDVEQQCEDTPRDMACYTDSAGHTYDFAFGMNYAGVIRDTRVEKYAAAPLTAPENKGKI